MQKKTFTFFFAVSLCISSQSINAEVYKWIDEKGNVVYGDKPVSKDEAEQVTIKEAPKKDKHTQQNLEKQQKLLDVMQEERDEKLAAEAEEQAKIEEQEQECAEIRRELEEMIKASFLYEETDDPDNPIIISDEERQAEQEKYQKFLDKNC